jgi:preflagellin peptidase FlaK
MLGPLSNIATVPDLLRLLTIPFFGYVAWLDIKTRRVPNRTWIPLAVLAVVLLVWELIVALTGGMRPGAASQFYILTLISIGFLIPLAYLFWRIGGFGGADAKAFFIIAVLFPTYPEYQLWRIQFGEFRPEQVVELLPGVADAAVLPAVEATLGVFAVTILSNTVVMGALYPGALAVRNALTGQFSPGMFVGKPVRWDAVTEEYGTILEFPDRRFRDDLSLAGISEFSNWRGLDLDALRMYLQWRGVTLEQLREDPDWYRNPASLSDEQNPPGDGSITGESPDSLAHSDARERTAAVENSITANGAGNEATAVEDEPPDVEASTDEAEPDEWAAEAFLDDIEGSAYGTTPETLRNSLDALTTRETVWISPGIPFLVPLFVGLLAAFVYGDVLFAILSALGVAG